MAESQRKSNKDLTPNTKLSIVAFLLEHSVDLKVPYHFSSQAAERFGRSESSVSRTWRATVNHRRAGGALPSFESKRQGNCGRKKHHTDIPERLSALPYEFSSLDHRIYIDEKWFYMMETDITIYMAPHETPPHRTVQSKRFIAKVMFMAAVMRPIYGTDGSMVFDGKIGMWPFVERVPAVRSSRNRAAGTLVTRSVNIGCKEQIAMLIDNVIPAIKSKCPSTLRGTELIIQQDGARCHVSPHDPVIRAACKQSGWNITLDVQPPNSPRSQYT